MIFKGNTRPDLVCEENDVLQRPRSIQPNWDPKNQTRYNQRKFKELKDFKSRDEAIEHVVNMNKQMNSYKRSRPMETETFISNEQWEEISTQFPHACEPCTKAKSRYNKCYTAVIHKTPGDHVNPLREQLKYLMANQNQIDESGNILCSLCNSIHSVRDGAFTVICMDDGNTDVPLPTGNEELITHMILVNIEEASVAELAHAWVADFSDLETNMLVTILGGTTESIIQRYSTPEITATWDCFRQDIKRCRSIHKIWDGTNENQLIVANPLRFPCIWSNLYDVGGNPKEHKDRHLILKELVHVSNVLNA